MILPTVLGPKALLILYKAPSLTTAIWSVAETIWACQDLYPLRV